MIGKTLLEFDAKCYKNWWNPFLLRFHHNGIQVDIDIDQQFPMMQEEWIDIQPNKEYVITISERLKPIKEVCTRVGHDLYECSCNKCIKLDIELENIRDKK